MWSVTTCTVCNGHRCGQLQHAQCVAGTDLVSYNMHTVYTGHRCGQEVSCAATVRSCRWRLLSHTVTVYWHWANQSKYWPRHTVTKRLVGQPQEQQYLSPWCDSGGIRTPATWLKTPLGNLVVRRTPRERQAWVQTPLSLWGFSPRWSHTTELTNWYCQAPGVIGSKMGLVGPVSVCCDWVR